MPIKCKLIVLTEWLRKFVRKPRLKTPTAVYMHATSSDSWMACWLYCACTATCRRETQ
jgi:hypothetical protein